MLDAQQPQLACASDGGTVAAGERAEQPGLSLGWFSMKNKEAGTVTMGLTDQERSDIEERITRLYNDLQDEAVNLNPDGVLAHLSDVCDLGTMSDGEWFPTMASFMSPIRENYSRQERLEEEIKELRAVALAPNATVPIV